MTRHDVDPDGDVILVFTNPRPGFDVHAELIKYSLYISDSEDDESEDDDSEDKDPDDDGPGLKQVEVDAESAPESELGHQIEEIRVSSSHLALTSPYFKQALKGTWKEADTLRTQGSVRMDQEDGDFEAMLILMNIIHGRIRSVPQIVPLEMLARFTILVHVYECDEAVQMFSNIWIEELKKSMPQSLCKEAVLWIFIVSVFKRSEEFKGLTSLALKESRGPINTLELPAISKVMDDIERQRNAATGDLIGALHDLVNDLIQNESQCSFECGSILLGGLIKGMHTRKLFSPYPRPPLLGLSFASLAGSIRGMPNPRWCSLTTNRRFRHYDSHRDHDCKLRHGLETLVTALEGKMEGLELASYV